MKPHARRDGLVVKELPGETLVYDLERHRAHCLNATAAWVWQRSDGKTSVEKIAESLRSELEACSAAHRKEMVLLALERLGKAHLLRERMPGATTSRYSRRELARKLVLASGLLLPAVTSIVAPTAAEAQTCVTLAVCQSRTPPCGGEPICGMPLLTCKSKPPGICTGD